MAIHYDRETGRLNKGSRLTYIHEQLEVQMWRIYPKMYRVSENGHPYFCLCAYFQEFMILAWI